MSDNIKFGLAIPQGWRGGDFPLEEENDPVSQYEFSKSIATTADNLNFNSIYAYDHPISFLIISTIYKKTFSNVLLYYLLLQQLQKR